MYYVKLDNEFVGGFGKFYRPDMEITEPTLETEVNSIGYFHFTVYPIHPLYNDIIEPRRILSLCREGEKEPLFVGRLLSYESGMFNERKLTFESELAFLTDTVWWYPRESENVSSNIELKTAREHLIQWIDRHNTGTSYRNDNVYAQSLNRKFHVRTISEKLGNHRFFVSPEKYSGTHTTLELMTSLLIGQYGGIFRISHEDDMTYIDWLTEEDIAEQSSHTQPIRFGENLIDIDRCTDRSNIFTVIRPFGDELSTGQNVSIKAFDASEYITDPRIKQVLNTTYSGSSVLRYCDCLYSVPLVNKYGWIQRDITFDDAKTGKSELTASELKSEQQKLVEKSCNILLSMSETGSLTITAADLAQSGNEIENFKSGDIVNVISNIHGYNGAMLVTAVTLDLADPSNNTVTFGSEQSTVTSQASRALSGSTPYTSGYSGNSSGGFVKVDDMLSSISVNPVQNKVIKAKLDTIEEKLVPATNSALGLIKVGSGLSISQDGTLSVESISVQVDNALSSTSENPVQNKVINTYIYNIYELINGKLGINEKAASAVQADSANNATSAETVRRGSYSSNNAYPLALFGDTTSGSNYSPLGRTTDITYNPYSSTLDIDGGNGEINGNANGVKQIHTESRSEHPILLSSSMESELSGTEDVYGSPKRADLVTINPGIGRVTARTFKGSLDGNASTADYATSARTASSADNATSADYAVSAGKLSTARTINGVSFDGTANITIPRSNKRIARASGREGSSGYIKICTITTKAYADHPLTFKIAQRGIPCYDVTILFNTTSSSDPTVAVAYTNSWYGNPAVYYVKSATSTWDIYIRKSGTYDHIYIQDYFRADGNEGYNYSVTWKDEQVSSLPSGYTQFTNKT